jgi:DNA polymerase-3 subunit epsilon
MDFVAFDVETANPDLASVCQIGVVEFRGGTLVSRWKSLINPQDFFDPINVAVHGISEPMVKDAPTFPDIAAELCTRFAAPAVCHHTAFDRAAIRAVHERHSLDVPVVPWLDTARVVRRTWRDRARAGYGLAAVAEMLGIKFTHHDAEEDARAAGEIFLNAIEVSGLSVEAWLKRAMQPISSRSGNSERHNRDGNPEGPLFGESVVFTGALTIPRREAADLAAEAGCEVCSSVTKATTLLVVGDQDVTRLAGHEKSSKHRKAEALIEQGLPIRILRETDFRALVAAPMGE